MVLMFLSLFASPWHIHLAVFSVVVVYVSFRTVHLRSSWCLHRGGSRSIDQALWSIRRVLLFLAIHPVHEVPRSYPSHLGACASDERGDRVDDGTLMWSRSAPHISKGTWSGYPLWIQRGGDSVFSGAWEILGVVIWDLSRRTSGSNLGFFACCVVGAKLDSVLVDKT